MKGPPGQTGRHFAGGIFMAHYNDVIMSTMKCQMTSITSVYSTVNSAADQRKHQSPASLAFVLGIHRWQVNSQHKWPVTRKMFPFDDVIMFLVAQVPNRGQTVSLAKAHLTHWGRVTHICVGKLTIIGSDNGLLPGRRQAIIWTDDRILLIGPLGKKISEILIEIQTFPLKKIRLKMSSAKWGPFRFGLNVLISKNVYKIFATNRQYLDIRVAIWF